MLKILFLLLALEYGPEWTLSAPTHGDTKFLSLVEKEALKLTDESLSDDQIVTQETAGSDTIYRHTKSEKHGSPVWHVKGTSDIGKPVVVLKRGEDFLPICNQKRTFVVLKQVGSTYRALFAYVRNGAGGDLFIEWDGWFPRGNPRNKASSFGFIRCTKSSMLPCKKELQAIADDSPDYEDLPENSASSAPVLTPTPTPIEVHEGPESDYYCDLSEGGVSQIRFTGAVVGAMVHSMVVLTGAEMIYNDNSNLETEVKNQVQQVAEETAAQGRSMGNDVAATEDKAASKVVDIGKQSVAGGTLLFYAAVVKVGALAFGQTPKENDSDDIAAKYKTTGVAILQGLIQGASLDDPEQNLVNPNPGELLKETVAQQLIAGQGLPKTEQQSGRGFLNWIIGNNDDGKSNGEQAIRQYGGMQKDGSVSGSKGIDNFNAAVDNAFGNTSKSAGQIFSENLIGGIYMPFGLIEDAGDAIAGGIFGTGRVSDDRTFADDLADKIMGVVAGAAGQIVDVAGDILAPIGLGGVAKGVSGFAAGALGFTGAVLASPVLGIYEAIKVGAKAFNVGGIIGMHGSDSRVNQGGNQNTNRNSPGPIRQQAPQYLPQLPQPGAAQPQTPTLLGAIGQTLGRKRRDAPTFSYEHFTAITDVDLFSHLGWITEDVQQEKLPEATLTQEEPFIGFANCLYKKTSNSDFEAAKDGKSIAKLYMRILRTQCQKETVDSLIEIISKGYLALQEDKTFSVPSTLPVLSKSKISIEEISELSRAFEFSAFTKAYISSLKSPAQGSISRNVATLKLMTMTFLEETKTLAPNHIIKLSRNLGKLLKSAFTKSLQDFFRIQHCRKCTKADSVKQSINNTIFLKALLDFVLVEQERSKNPSEKIINTFDKWFVAKRNEFTNQLPQYFL